MIVARCCAGVDDEKVLTSSNQQLEIQLLNRKL